MTYSLSRSLTIVRRLKPTQPNKVPSYLEASRLEEGEETIKKELAGYEDDPLYQEKIWNGAVGLDVWGDYQWVCCDDEYQHANEKKTL